jgi:hypothetical protein
VNGQVPMISILFALTSGAIISMERVEKSWAENAKIKKIIRKDYK